MQTFHGYSTGMLFTKVRTPVSVLCVNFACANSYVRNAIHKTFLRVKNRKFVRKYMHGLSCRTTENFRKDSELMKKLP